MEIKLMIDGVGVRGEIVLRTDAEIDVVIVSPYRNLSGGLHIIYCARSFVSFAGELGDRRARELLESLYELGRHLEANMEPIRGSCRRAEAEIDAIPDRVGEREFREGRLALRRRLRGEGRLDAKSYQQELGILRRRKAMYEKRIAEIRRAFFDRSFPMCVPWGTSDEVIAILEGRRSLFAA